MAQGTGLPLPKEGTALSQASSISADAVSSAAAWTKIAAAGNQIEAAGEDALSKAVHLQQAGAVADFENEWRTKGIEARDQFSKDPVGFKNWAQSSIDGAVDSVPPWMAAHAKSFLTRTFDGHYAGVLSERRSEDTRLATEALTTRRKGADDDVMALATAGKVGTPEWNAAIAVHQSVLHTAVQTGALSLDTADYLQNDLAGRAQGEVAARNALGVYKEKGFDSAVQYLRTEIRENDKLSLKPTQREAAFNRGLSSIRLQQAQDKQDRGEYVAVSTDLRARIDTNQPYDPGEVRDTLTMLQKTGAAAEFQRLSVAHATSEATAPYRTGLNLKEFGAAVASRRGAAPAQAEQSAMDFFQSRGWSKEQSAGIVGNLVHESGLDPTAVHDNNTGLGIAGHRLERLDALKQYAASKGKPVTDFQTQLEFVDQELRTTEAGAGNKLRGAKTAQEAAAAFVNFERPVGYDPNNPAAAHGFSNRVGQAVRLAGGDTPEITPGVPGSGAVTKRVQAVFVEQAQAAWPDFKRRIDAGQTLDVEDMNAIHYAALLSGKANWIAEVESLATANKIGLKMAGLPETQRQAVMDEAQGKLNGTVSDSLRKQFDRQNKMVRESPVDFAVERGMQAPDPINLGSSDVARAGVAQRVNLARGVSEQQETPPGSPFRTSDRAALAGAISNGKPEQAAVAMDAISSVPDEMLIPALRHPEIKDAISGAARSSDPARYSAAMSFMDKMWARAPETAKQLFGDDAIHSLMTWQANSRYATPDQLAQERSKQALDPQIRARQDANLTEGKSLARDFTAADVTKQFDTSWWITPGPVARAIGSQPTAPIDTFTRDALMGDFETQFAKRYADTLDKNVAAKQTAELLKTKWAASPVNGGRLMTNGPEKYYPAVDGSWDWMTKQIETDLAGRLGRERRNVGTARVASGSGTNWDYSLVSDRATQSEAQAGQMPSYQVVITDGVTGKASVLPERYRFDPSGSQAKARANFDDQRKRVLEQINNPMDGFSGGVMP